MSDRASAPLTREQQAIVDAAGSLYVEACPGAGKTHTLVELFLSRAQRCAPRQGIALLSFTNAAVEELERRATARGLRRLVAHPHFVGTLDAFIGRFLVLPFQIRPSNAPAFFVRRLLASWADIDAKVAGVSLDAARLEVRRRDGALIHQALPSERLPEKVRRLVKHLANEAGRSEKEWLSQWVPKVEEAHRRLRRAGLFSTADARSVALHRLLHPRAGPLLSVLARRFSCVILDEAQDADELDRALLNALQLHGATTIVVGDPDQSIFGFRSPAEVGMGPLRAGRSLHTLTGTFRSAREICAVTSTLRATARKDTAVGPAGALQGRVIVWAAAKAEHATVLLDFVGACAAAGIKPAESVVLAHRWSTLVPFGADRRNEGGGLLARLARAVHTWLDGNALPGSRLASLRTAEFAIWRRMHDGTESVLPAVTESQERWLRTAASSLLGRLGEVARCSVDAAGWRTGVLDALWAIHAPPGLRGRRQRDIFGNGAAVVPPPARPSAKERPACSTVHRMKGLEARAALLVLDDRGLGIEEWSTRAPDSEARRVLYVGATRASELLCVVAPLAHADRVKALLESDGGSAELRHVAGNRRRARSAR